MAEDHGVLDELEWARSESTDCYDGSIMGWKAASAVCAFDTASENYDQIDSNGSNVWRFDVHFPERPKALLGPCSANDNSANWAYPVNFRFDIEIGDNESKYELYLTDPAPEDGENDSENDEKGLALNIIGGYGNVYTSLGAAIGDYIIDSSSGTYVDQISNGEGMLFDIDVSGDYYDLPREEDSEAKAAQVSVRVNNEYPPGDNHEIIYVPEYTFSYAYLDETTCSCSDFYRTQKTTTPFSTGYGVFESV